MQGAKRPSSASGRFPFFAEAIKTRRAVTPGTEWHQQTRSSKRAKAGGRSEVEISDGGCPSNSHTPRSGLAAPGRGRRAQADGAFPDEFSIHFPPDAPNRISIGANFGLLVSEDDGLSWHYACEPWIVAGSNAALANNSVSFYQVTRDGAYLATSVNLTRSSDVACTWPISTGAVAGQRVADIFPDPNDASFVLAIVVFPIRPPSPATFWPRTTEGRPSVRNTSTRRRIC